MTPALLQLAVGYLALVGILSCLAALGVRCATAVRTGLIVAELLLVAQATIDVVAQLRGHRPSDPATHLGYLLVSVLLLPLLVSRTDYLAPDAENVVRSDQLVVLVACAASIVVVVRLHATWR